LLARRIVISDAPVASRTSVTTSFIGRWPILESFGEGVGCLVSWGGLRRTMKEIGGAVFRLALPDDARHLVLLVVHEPISERRRHRGEVALCHRKRAGWGGAGSIGAHGRDVEDGESLSQN
jgi:hypothetical protein